MLKVVIELLPGGDPTRRRTLGLMTIGNESQLAPISDYAISGSEGANTLAGTSAWMASTRIEGHPRDESVWRLVAKAASALADADHVEW